MWQYSSKFCSAGSEDQATPAAASAGTQTTPEDTDQPMEDSGIECIYSRSQKNANTSFLLHIDEWTHNKNETDTKLERNNAQLFNANTTKHVRTVYQTQRAPSRLFQSPGTSVEACLLDKIEMK